MPYINKLQREVYEPYLSDVCAFLTRHTSSGELNFLFSTIIGKYWKESGGGYTAANNIVGALECAKQEFIRRHLNAYEDKKILDNGDLEF